MQAIRDYKCVFGRNLYDTDETNTILELRLTLYCPIFEEIKSSFLNVADFLNLRVVTLLILMLSLILYFLQCRYKNKNIMMRTVK
jgi:hypothetical protein